MHWWKHWFLLATHRCCSLEYAEKVLVSEHFEGKHTVHYVKDVITLNEETMKLMQVEKEKWLDVVPFEDSSTELPAKLPIHFQSGVFKRKLLIVDLCQTVFLSDIQFTWQSLIPSDYSNANSCDMFGTYRLVLLQNLKDWTSMFQASFYISKKV